MDYAEYLKGLQKCADMLEKIVGNDQNLLPLTELSQLAYIQGYLSAAKYHVQAIEKRGQ